MRKGKKTFYVRMEKTAAYAELKIKAKDRLDAICLAFKQIKDKDFKQASADPPPRVHVMEIPEHVIV